MRPRTAFTLIELMVVITIVGLVSVFVLPAVVATVSQSSLDGSARVLQGAISGAHDAAVLANAPRGLRFVPDPANPAKLNRIVPLTIAAPHTDGLVSLPPAGYVSPIPCLTLVESLLDPSGLPAIRTSWAWNARVGDRLTIGSNTYTVCGPQFQANPEGFVNYDPTGTPFPVMLNGTTVYRDFLQLANGRDDNGDGFTDNGWDGIDNDGINGIDDAGEWEPERWLAPVADNSAYSLIRRAIPGNPTSTLALSAPIDLASSVLPVNGLGAAEIMVAPDGSISFPSFYGVPSSVSLGQAKSVFSLIDGDNQRSITLWAKTGRMESE